MFTSWKIRNYICKYCMFRVESILLPETLHIRNKIRWKTNECGAFVFLCQANFILARVATVQEMISYIYMKCCHPLSADDLTSNGFMESADSVAALKSSFKFLQPFVISYLLFRPDFFKTAITNLRVDENWSACVISMHITYITVSQTHGVCSQWWIRSVKMAANHNVRQFHVCGW